MDQITNSLFSTFTFLNLLHNPLKGVDANSFILLLFSSSNFFYSFFF